jgi:hypothetical protein
MTAMQTAAGWTPSTTTTSDAASQGGTLAQVVAALERLGFSVQPPLPEGNGGTQEEQARIRQWLDEQQDAFNEDLSRILLGENSAHGQALAPASDLEDCLRRVRPLVEELARQLQWVA